MKQDLLDKWANDNVPVDRPSWDEYFMKMAELTAQRSLDASTKFGTVLVRNKTVISTGYNSFIGNVDSSVLPNNTRPDKYNFMIHSEHNALLNCAKNGIPTLGVSCYVTGLPCNNCLQFLWQAGIKEVVYLDVRAKMCVDERFLAEREILLDLIGDDMTFRKFPN